MKHYIEERVISYVEDQAPSKKIAIDLDIRLREDLGIDGADATELLSGYSEHFGVDMSEFNFSDYFNHEINALLFPFALMYTLYSLIFRRTAQSELRSIRIRDLVKSAEAGTWTAPH